MHLTFELGLGQETYYHEGLVDNLREGKALTLEGQPVCAGGI
ncbi:MAG: hypothetical protein ACLTW9_01655 [Enterocloster sp.]